ncbi:hypothetical protein [Amphritea japonica]|uniref:Uncharacterized protein n=1 Tax=Amphritea japonica ATCC BAA-1530 TaxID=1278309 RepID=A0A7R6PB89_9GAMM|nr:hypothetical protein [Amphritea japonica]BBB26812.1 hypothetical protein AMJAP_2221 [Amphritea japonica ATCC BAA-1530]
MDDLNQQIVDAGNWWFNPWWLEDRWYSPGATVQKVDIVEAIELLKTVLTKEWVMSLGDDPFRHCFIQLIHFGKGLSQLSNIYQQAKKLRLALELDGHESIIDSYKRVEQAGSAKLELFMAYVMSETGYDVSFIKAKPKKGRTPDILVDLQGNRFVVECKSLQDSVTEQWFDDYVSEFGRLVMFLIPTGYEVAYRPIDIELDPSDYGYPNYGSYKLAATVDALPIIQKLKQIGPFTPKYQYHDLGSKGELYIAPSGVGLTGRMAIPEITQAFVSRRLLSNGVKKAAAQILEYGLPGMVSVFYTSPPDIGVLKCDLLKLFAADIDAYKLVIGVLIFPAQNILRYIQPIWVSNPYADNKAEDFGLPSLLSKELDPLV